MELVIPLYLFDATSGEMEEEIKLKTDLSDVGKGKKIRCLGCQYIITDETQRISINGSHFHNRSNPSGICFNFGCFQNAPGCTNLGTATGEYTWFTGYMWQISVCRSCGEHLGWFFKGESGFYGLISARLMSEQNGTD